MGMAGIVVDSMGDVAAVVVILKKKQKALAMPMHGQHCCRSSRCRSLSQLLV